MKIYFTRHGESEANLLHEISNHGLRHPLTRRGRRQAEELATRLQGLPLTRIYSSPVLRAIETSIILANRLDLDYQVVEALREYDCGILEGSSDAATWQAWQELFDAWTIHSRWEKKLEGGETFYDVRKRFVPFIESLVQSYAHTDAGLVCVGHGGLYWMMLPQVLKNVDFDFIKARKGFGYTTCIVAEARQDGLVCVEWNGEKT